MELETKVTQLQEELALRGGSRTNKSNDDVQLPRAPERHRLTQHRAPVTAVAFHPVFTIIATASEDSTIKLWDYETGVLAVSWKRLLSFDIKLFYSMMMLHHIVVNVVENGVFLFDNV
jgi:WD40 repeat protein